ncbi:MAG: hypothetical protein P8Y93_13810, partial [Acidobacteriota bacterium]
MKSRFKVQIVGCCVLAFAYATLGAALEFDVSFAPEVEAKPLDGRVLVLLSTDGETEPRFQVRAGVRAIQIFGVEVEGLSPGAPVRIDRSVYGYPVESLADLPPGQYWVQAVLHRYETFDRADGHQVRLP